MDFSPKIPTKGEINEPRRKLNTPNSPEAAPAPPRRNPITIPKPDDCERAIRAQKSARVSMTTTKLLGNHRASNIIINAVTNITIKAIRRILNSENFLHSLPASIPVAEIHTEIKAKVREYSKAVKP